MQIEINPSIGDVEQFCKDCASLNYNNNRSLQAMKYDWCIEQGGAWWAAYDEDFKQFRCKCKAKNCCGYIVRAESRWRINKKYSMSNKKKINK